MEIQGWSKMTTYPQPMLKAKAKEAGRRVTVGEDKAYDAADRSCGQPARH
jgi:hypothetical protein